MARDSCTRRVVCGVTVRFKISSFVAPTTRRALHNVWENARGEVCAMLLCCFPMYTGETPWFRQLFVEHYVSEFWFHLYINSIVEKKKFFFYASTYVRSDSFSHENLHHLSENKEPGDEEEDDLMAKRMQIHWRATSRNLCAFGANFHQRRDILVAISRNQLFFWFAGAVVTNMPINDSPNIGCTPGL